MKKHITQIASWFTKKCFVVSVTVDDEASPNAIIDWAIESVSCRLHLIRFRCSFNTLEVMIESIACTFLGVYTCVEKLKGATNTIQNHK